ncbi:response regulator transcription factor [Streptomyces sp. TRM 70361]|uniref:response regulator transcription factor n=1 Tax=Streptomyces sp. TRM 70361 TaxID=3116553 RepID=UPI002E7BC5AB|nr:response regulator transcription factor [Streptomyces sp. TRM 70361]MEE1942778.1 response regulator transcription factor [Streptomyces sp. TRM 70361]
MREKVLIVENFPILSFAVEQVLSTSESVSVVGVASDFDSSVELARQYRPDVVLQELCLPTPPRGLALCRAMKDLPCSPRVVVFTTDNTPRTVADSVAVGVDSFVHKSVPPGKLLEALERCTEGRRTWWLGDDYGDEDASAAAPEELGTMMTDREKEILSLLVQRYTNDEIARELRLARQTVKNYVSSVLGKVGVPSRRHLFTRPG